MTITEQWQMLEHIVTLAEVNTVFFFFTPLHLSGSFSSQLLFRLRLPCFPAGFVGCQVSGNPARPPKKVGKDLFESCFAECQTYWVA